jgi:hypothetical protein
MVIDSRVERLTRTMLGHAIRHELHDLAALIRRTGGEPFAACVPLWLFASAYIAIDVSGRWPTDTDLHDIAERAAKSGPLLDISDLQIYQYLSRVALGQQQLADVFSDEALATIPLFATANLLTKFTPEEKQWWEYLDQIWDAAESAERVRLSVLPALLLRAHKERLSGSAHSRLMPS